MELDSTVQVVFEDLKNQNFDLFIAACGYETRSIFLPQRLASHQAKRKVAIAFTEHCGDLSRPFNDKVLTQLGFEFCDTSMLSTEEINRILSDLCISHKKEELNILVDYSSMPKLWYNAIINYFLELESEHKNVHICFSYTPSEYTKATKNISNKFLDSAIPASSSSKPKALVIGLGYEKGRAEELANKLKADVTYSFYSDPAVDPRFVAELIDNNKSVLNNLESARIIKYPIYDLNFINTALTNLCVDLRLTHQIVLAPLGPKPFTLMCFLINARYPDTKIWRITSGLPKEVADRKPNGELLIYKVLFTSEGVDYDE